MVDSQSLDQLVRPLRSDLPRFDGSEARTWVFHAEQYFEHYRVDDLTRVRIASYYLDGLALQWFQWLNWTNPITSWSEFTTALEIRFAPLVFENPGDSLAKLQQPSTVEEYTTTYFTENSKIHSGHHRFDESPHKEFLCPNSEALGTNVFDDIHFRDITLHKSPVKDSSQWEGTTMMSTLVNEDIEEDLGGNIWNGELSNGDELAARREHKGIAGFLGEADLSSRLGVLLTMTSNCVEGSEDGVLTTISTSIEDGLKAEKAVDSVVSQEVFVPVANHIEQPTYQIMADTTIVIGRSEETLGYPINYSSPSTAPASVDTKDTSTTMHLLEGTTANHEDTNDTLNVAEGSKLHIDQHVLDESPQRELMFITSEIHGEHTIDIRASEKKVDVHQVFDEIPPRDIERYDKTPQPDCDFSVLNDAHMEVPPKHVHPRTILDTPFRGDPCSPNDSPFHIYFQIMAREGAEAMKNVVIDKYLAASIVITGLGALEQRKSICEYINKSGIEVDSKLATAIIDMYCKCGCIDKAFQVFNGLQSKGISSWNSMIGGLSMHGRGNDAIKLLEEMEKEKKAIQ